MRNQDLVHMHFAKIRLIMSCHCLLQVKEDDEAELARQQSMRMPA